MGGGTGGQCKTRLVDPGVTATTATVNVTINATDAVALAFYFNPRNGTDGNYGIYFNGTNWYVVADSDANLVTLATSSTYAVTVQDTGSSIIVTCNGVEATAFVGSASSTQWTLESVSGSGSSLHFTIDAVNIDTP